MPFRSKAQQGFLFMHHPDVAKKFAAETPKADYAQMPQHVKPPHPAASAPLPHVNPTEEHVGPPAMAHIQPPTPSQPEHPPMLPGNVMHPGTPGVPMKSPWLAMANHKKAY